MVQQIPLEKAKRAKARANEKSTAQFDVVEILCPACNRPVAYCEPDPNEYVQDETQGDWGNDRAAFEFSPADIMDSSHSNPWDAVHVVPERVEVEEGEFQLRVIAYKHDFDSEGYEVFMDEISGMEEVERRAAENSGLGDFA